MADNAKLERTGDRETDEILNEIEREGAPADHDEEDEDAPVEAKKKNASQPDEHEEAAPGSEEEAENADDAEDGGESEEEGGEGGERHAPAPKTSVPASKYNYQKQRAAKIEAEKAAIAAERDAVKAELEKLKGEKSQIDFTEKLKAIAAKEKISPERLTEIAEVIRESVGRRDPAFEAKLDRALQVLDQQQNDEAQAEEFNNEFDSYVLPILKKDKEMTPERIEEIRGEVYEKAMAPIPENDFDPATGKPRKSLVQFYLDLSDNTGGRRITGERSRIRSISGEGKKTSISEMSPEDIENMSDEEFDKISDEAGRSSPSLVKPQRRI